MPIILVIDDVEESRNGIELLLRADGYVVEVAHSEADAIAKATHRPPQLILLNLGLPPFEAAAAARRTRDRSLASDGVPVVIFCIEATPPRGNVDLGGNVYMAHPDNFNQLREFLGLLLAMNERPS